MLPSIVIPYRLDEGDFIKMERRMTEFFKLPDGMNKRELKQCFLDFLEVYAKSTSTQNIEYALSELLELADRQWHTYELLDEDIKRQIEHYIIYHLEFQDEEMVDTVLCIVPRLSLGKVFQYLQQKRKYIKNECIVADIVDAEKEYGAHVENPFYGLENGKK